MREGTLSRRLLREHCFKLLFCLSFHPKEESDDQFEGYMQQQDEDEENEEGNWEIVHRVELSQEQQEQVRERVSDMLQYLAQIDERLAEETQGWSLKRIGRVELTLLRLACYEIMYDEHVPDKVAVNEAVEMAKQFGGDESGSFVNGILAKLMEKNI